MTTVYSHWPAEHDPGRLLVSRVLSSRQVGGGGSSHWQAAVASRASFDAS
jgi:hypothetical protein